MDIDGVLYDWHGTAKFLLQHHFGTFLAEATSWNYLENMVTKDQWKWLWKEGISEHGLFRHGNCHKGAFEAMDAIAKKHDLVLITARPERAAADTMAWIAYHQIPTCEIHIVGNRHRKLEIKPCDLYVDDKPETVLDLYDAGLEALLWSRSWNQDVQDTRLRRISSWSQVFAEIRRLESLLQPEEKKAGSLPGSV